MIAIDTISERKLDSYNLQAHMATLEVIKTVYNICVQAKADGMFDLEGREFVTAFQGKFIPSIRGKLHDMALKHIIDATTWKVIYDETVWPPADVPYGRQIKIIFGMPAIVEETMLSLPLTSPTQILKAMNAVSQVTWVEP